VTLKCQGRDPIMFGVIENGRRYRLGDNGAPIGNDYLGFKWSRDWSRDYNVT